MNIGIVTTWFDRGAGYVSAAYHETLSKSAKVFIYTRGNDKGVKISEFWNQDYVTWGAQVHIGIPTYIVWPDFKKWIVKNNIDTVLFNEQQSWDVIIRCQKLDIKIGAYVDYYTPDTVSLFWLYDFLICNTQRHFSVFKEHPQAIYIPWGTNCRVFTPNFKKREIVTFFHSCGMNPYRKGTDLLLGAFSRLKKECKLIIHTQVEFKHHESLSIIANDNRIKVIHGTVPPPGLFHLGDIYVYPTRLEGIGLTIMEALACGLPVITTDDDPMKEFVTHKENGFLISIEKFQRRSDGYYWAESICDERDLTETMKYCIDHPEQVENLKLRARSHAEKHLDWELNSSDLSERIKNSTKLKKEQRILLTAMQYEYGRYPKMMLWALARKVFGRKKV